MNKTTVPPRSWAPVSEQLWRNVHDRLSAFVAQRIENPADVADLVQTVFLRVHQHAERIDDEARLLRWLFQVTRNAIADFYRSPARRRETLRVDPDGSVLAGREPTAREADERTRSAREAMQPAASASDVSALADLATCVRPIVDQLPPTYRDALTFVEFEGISQTAVAARLGISVSGMKSRVQRGRAMLRDMLLACCDVSRSATGGVLDFAPRQPTRRDAWMSGASRATKRECQGRAVDGRCRSGGQ